MVVLSDGELMRVPMVSELVGAGGVEVVERNKKGEASVYKLLKSGSETISHAMLHNGNILRDDDVLRKQYEINAIYYSKQSGGSNGKRKA